MSKMRIVLATLLALAVASPALAVDVTWKGDFNNRFMYSTQADVASFGALSSEGTGKFYNEASVLNAPNTHKSDHDSDFSGEVKYRLWVTASDDEKKVKGVTAFEFGGLKFGQSPVATGGNTIAVDNSGELKGLDFGGDDNVFELRWAYVDFEVPFDPSSRLSVGLMPVGYNKFLWNDNAAGVKWSSKRGAFGYSLGWWRNEVTNFGRGGAAKLGNDDVYAIDLTYAPVPTGKLNVFYLFKEDGHETIDGVADSMDQTWWLGVAGEGQIENIFFGGTFIYMGGEAKANTSNGLFTNSLGQTSNSWDKGAWLLNAEVTAKLDNARLRLGWLYSTGDDDEDDNDLEGFQNIDAYMGYFGSAVIFDNFADDNTTVATPYIRNKGLNMPYVTADVDVTEKASVGASYLWINAAEDIDGPDPLLDGDTAIGHELDVRASYKVAKGMTVGLQAGYLVGGNGWDELGFTGTSKDSDNVFRADASVRYKF